MVPDALLMKYLRCRIHRPANIQAGTKKALAFAGAFF
ncbi:hypothetical protein SAMN05192585_10922 [Acetanaerobacterium elongatum]|uniref:Uncharacterized protein n=1 Tax=Acetanaerobacterium elongatum TaxID=258515 RepID=A0A1G9XR79_9FIRM|nr:hypothetical protein SAMN05192585_10922 [Acetanaerobacterium elongatum]